MAYGTWHVPYAMTSARHSRRLTSLHLSTCSLGILHWVPNAVTPRVVLSGKIMCGLQVRRCRSCLLPCQPTAAISWASASSVTWLNAPGPVSLSRTLSLSRGLSFVSHPTRVTCPFFVSLSRALASSSVSLGLPRPAVHVADTPCGTCCRHEYPLCT